MRLALYKYEHGEPTTLPLRVKFHLIAARYGTTPGAVREWPAEDFADAVSFLGVTSG